MPAASTRPCARPSRQPPRAGGFTLLELLVVIAIVAIVSSALMPFLIRPEAQARLNETIREMSVLEEAINGRPDRGDYGFLGTIGSLPAAVDGVLARLVDKGDTLDAVAFSSMGIPIGWNGPYVRTVTASPLRDGWGVPYEIVNHATDTTLWQLRSRGPNRAVGGDDDIVFPSPTTYFSSAGTVRLEFRFVRNGVRLPVRDNWISAVRYFFPVEGKECLWNTPGNPADCDASCAIGGSACVLRNGDDTEDRKVPLGLHVVEVDFDPITTGCIPSGGNANCDGHRRMVEIRRAANVVTVDLTDPWQLPNPATFNCTLASAYGATTNDDTTTNALCSAVAQVAVAAGTQKLVTVHASGTWNVSGSGNANCMLRLKWGPMGGALTNSVNLLTGKNSDETGFSASYPLLLGENVAGGWDLQLYAFNEPGVGNGTCHVTPRTVVGTAIPSAAP